MTSTPQERSKESPCGVPPAQWPDGWMATMLSVIAKRPGKPYKVAAPHALYWRAYVLVARDTDWQYKTMHAMRFDQIAPDGTVVSRHNGLPIVAKLSAEAMAAVTALKEFARPSGVIFDYGANPQNFTAMWHRLIRSAGFSPNRGEPFPAANGYPRTLGEPELPPPVEGEPQTVRQFFEHVYKPLRLGGKSHKTVLLYQISIRSFGKYLGRDAMLSDFKDDVVSAYLAHVRELGRAEATVLKEYSQLTAIWNFACRRHLVLDYHNVRKPTAPKEEPKSWLAADVQKLFARINELDGWICGVREKDWWFALHCVLWNCGERISAILALTWNDIDLEGNWVTFKAITRKGRGAGMTHALADYTVEALKRIKRPGEKEVFPWPKHRTYLWQCYANRILKPAGLACDRKSKFHRMRRSVATFYEALGGDATKLLGHFDRRVTEDHYLDPRIARRPQAIDRLPHPTKLAVAKRLKDKRAPIAG